MAKKKTTIVEEETPEPTEHDKAVLEALDPNAALELEPEKLDEKPEETPEEPKEEPTEPVLDKEAIKAELKAEVTEEVKKELTSQLEGTKTEQKDAYADFEKEIWDKEKRTPTYKEALDFVKIQAKDEIKAEFEAEAEAETKQEQEALKAQEAQQQQLNDSLNKTWDEQLNDLIKQGKIPQVVNADDNRVQVVKDNEGKEIERIPLDPGKKARYELFKAMYVASEERIKAGQEPLTNLKEIFYEHYGKKQPAGANAPIAGTRKAVSQSSDTFSYNEIHNKGFEDLLREAQ